MSKPKHVALHQRLGIPLDRPIPVPLLQTIIRSPMGAVIPLNTGFLGGGRVQVDTQLKYQANFALNTGQEQSGGYL